MATSCWRSRLDAAAAREKACLGNGLFIREIQSSPSPCGATTTRYRFCVRWHCIYGSFSKVWRDEQSAIACRDAYLGAMISGLDPVAASEAGQAAGMRSQVVNVRTGSERLLAAAQALQPRMEAARAAAMSSPRAAEPLTEVQWVDVNQLTSMRPALPSLLLSQRPLLAWCERLSVHCSRGASDLLAEDLHEG